MSDMENKDTAQAGAPAPQPEKSGSETSAKKDKTPKKDKNKKPSFGERFSRWLREMRSELKKVSWPSTKSVLKNVGIVVVCVLVVGLVIGVFDTLVRAVVDALLGLF